MGLVEMSADTGTSCVATETPHHFRLGNGTVHRLFDTGGGQQRSRWREVYCSEGLEVGDPGLEKICVLFLEQVGLTHASGPECPEQWKRQALIPVTYRVPILARLALNLILVLAWAKSHQWMCMQNVGKRSGHGRACHWGFLLRGRLGAVTPRASIGSRKVVSRRAILRGPEAGLGEMVLGRKLA